ncbi:hypothetical protein KJ840_02380 [Patescibacteria group bacterium]|nr:hypothetical protein [Patescibacteria group bacterium]
MLSIIIKVSTILTLVFSLALGIYTISRNHKSIIYWLWFLICLAATTWSVGYLWAIMTDNSNSVMTALMIVYTGATLIPILFFHFTIKFLLKEGKALLIVGYSLALILLYLNLFTNHLITGFRYLENFGYFEEVNMPVFYLYLTYFLFYTVFSIFLLLKNYSRANGFKKKQILFIAIAVIIGFGGGITNFVMALTGLYPIGQIFVFLYPILITYGIFLPEVRVRL